MKGYWETTIRALLKAAAGGLIAKGWVDAESAETAIGAIALLVSVGWGVWEKYRIKRAALQPTVSTSEQKDTQTV